MKKVLLRAPVLSQSGYGVHSRQIARWLLSRDDVDLTFHPVQWGVTPWYIDPNGLDGLIGEIHKRSTGNTKGPFDVSLQLQLPNEWDTSLARVNIGLTAGVETDVCHTSWIDCIKRMNHVVVPSSFVKAMFERTASLGNMHLDSDHVSVIPESFIDHVVQHVDIVSGIKFETLFNFLVVGQMTGRNSEIDRKNIFNTVKWFCEVFKDDPDVGLVVKSNNGRETKIDRRVTRDILRQTLGQVRKGAFPRVYLIHGNMNDEEMSMLYKHPTMKAFFTLTRGEGFGLPILEAAAAGLPVIATNWSGHLDFLNKGRFIKLDYELKQIPKEKVDEKIFVESAKWAQVSEADVKRKLKKFRVSSGTPTRWAVEMAASVRESFSQETVSGLYDKLLDKLAL